MARIVTGLSGGVDSSVAAYLLKEQGHEVIALYMINWYDSAGVLEGQCKKEEDIHIAEMVAAKIGIPFHVVDLCNEYRKRVVDYMFHEYEMGRTPNPDVLCNREVKFDAFHKKAMEFDAEFVATGHYARKEVAEGTPYFRLLRGIDENKDQSYFLCQLSQSQLQKALFPIGGITKPDVRKIASEAGLPSAEKKDSQGICFIGKVNLPIFLQQQLAALSGDIIEIPAGFMAHSIHFPEPGTSEMNLEYITAPFSFKPHEGKVVGMHNGAHFYTIGQRKGLGVGGKEEPLFVLQTDVKNNIVYVGQGHDHPGLNRRGLFIPTKEIHWIRPDKVLKPGENGNYAVRIRYRQSLQEARLFMKEKGAYIVFELLQRGITPGEFAAWYNRDELIGSGVISN